MSSTSINNSNKRNAINENSTSNKTIFVCRRSTRQSKHLPRSLSPLRLLTLRTNVTSLATIKTNHILVLAITSHMTHFTTSETSHLILLSLHIASTNRFPTLVTNNTSKSISPTSPLPLKRFLFPLTSWNIIRFPTALLTLVPLIKHNLIVCITIFLEDSTTINQIRKDTDFLITNRFLNLSTKAILKFNALRKLGTLTIIVRIKLSQLGKLRSIISDRHIPLFQLKELYLLLSPNILRVILPQELPTENFPRHFLTTDLKPLTSVNPPVISLFT